MADIFTEVEEQLRRDKYNTLLRQYGLWFAGAAFLIVLAVGGYELIWEPWQSQRIETASNAYQRAMETEEAGNVAEAEAQYAKISSGKHEGYAVLALMREAAIAADDGDAPRAAALYEQAGQKADNEAVSGLARMKALYVIADELNYGELLDRAEPLVAEGSAYQYSARELIATGAMKEGDYDRARKEYRFLNLAPETPQGVRRRAEEGLAALNRMQPEAAAPPESETPAEQGDTPNEEQSAE